MADAPRTPPKKRDWSWRSQAFRGLIYQIVLLALVAATGWFLAHNTAENMRVRGIQGGFDFLTTTAGFDIGESLFHFDSNDPYWKAFLVGIVNTLRVAAVGILLTTILGTLIGIGRFSRNGLVRGLCQTYVELFRNVPILIQLLMWYLLATELLPDITDARHIGPFYLSKGGLSFPIPEWSSAHLATLAGLAAGLVAAWAYRRRTQRRFEETGRLGSLFFAPLAIVIVGALIGWVAGGMPTAWEIPKKGEFAVEGGGSLTPEFLAVLMGLVLYTAAFVSEVVRSGIQSVAHGQSEAARALGLSRGQEMQKVLLPQALRVIIPPMTNQYLNLTKNSSLAVAIGYPDVVSIGNTAINQTGRAVECIALIMVVYLITSLATSLLMGWYNKKAAIKER
ncbi:MAG: ABC transporter permease subunit [Burkholderiales bacterium]|nr:ABC transporter permease subunit [Burkholderiales bacterium]